MNREGATSAKLTKGDLKREKLKEAVVEVLMKHPAGLDKNDLWNEVKKSSMLSVNAKTYGVSKISDLLNKWDDTVSIVFKRNKDIVRLRSRHPQQKDKDGETSSSGKVEEVNAEKAPRERKGSAIETIIESDGGTERIRSTAKKKTPAVEIIGSFPTGTFEDLDFTFGSAISGVGKDELENVSGFVADKAVAHMINDGKKDFANESSPQSGNTKVCINEFSDVSDTDDASADGTPVTKPLKVGTILDNPPLTEQQKASLPRWSNIGANQTTNPIDPLMQLTSMLPFGMPRFGYNSMNGQTHLLAGQTNLLTGQPLIRQTLPMAMTMPVARPPLSAQDTCQVKQPSPMSSASQPKATNETDDDDDDDTSDSDESSNDEKDSIHDNNEHVDRVLSKATGHNDVVDDVELKTAQKAPPTLTQKDVTNGPFTTLPNLLPSTGFNQSGRSQAAPVYVAMPLNTNVIHPNLVQPHFPVASNAIPGSMPLLNFFNNRPMGHMNQLQQGMNVPVQNVNMNASPGRSQSSVPSLASVNFGPLSPIDAQRRLSDAKVGSEKGFAPGESVSTHLTTQSSVQTGPAWAASHATMPMPSVPVTQSPVANPLSHLIPDIKLDFSDGRHNAHRANTESRIPATNTTQHPRQVVITKEDLNLKAAHLNAGLQHESRKESETSEPAILKFWDDCKERIIEPINKSEFEVRNIDVRPVYVPMGRNPTKEEIDKVAKECIEMLAESNEFVTPERIEKLVCQRFECNSIKALGLRYIDQLDSVNELNRTVCKVNAFILAFLKTRSICTLHELKECLRDYVPGKGDFCELKTGPLQRYPEVYKQFRFPPNMAEIPPITSMEIMDLFDSYLTHANQWTSRVEMEPFMNFLVDKYEADNAYMLGVRIRSLPLAVGVLKKAKRDAGNQRRGVYEHFKQNLRDEIEEAFNKFKVTLLQRGDRNEFEIRTHYLKMQPEMAIMEICKKLEVLMMIVESGTETFVRPKLLKVIENFLNHMRCDNLGKTLLHLAICMTSTSVQEEALELLKPTERVQNDGDTDKGHISKPPPRKDAVVMSLTKYIKNCLNVRALALPDFNRMEEKLLEEFGFVEFSQMGFGRFLDFLLRETQKVLEEGGGLQLGSGSGGSNDSETSFKPQQDDLYDFIGQCRQCGISQPSEIEAALCKQYSVQDVRNLGYGNMKLLLSHADKYFRRMPMAGMNVLYETPFVLQAGNSSGGESKVGILGHQTKEAAIICLHNCPLLENLAEWSQWNTVFEPQFGTLKNFIQVLKNKGVNQIKIEGGKFAEIDIMALEVRPGELIKLVATTSHNHFTSALTRRDVRSSCGHLVSLAIKYKGVGSMPLALLSSLIKTELLKMYAEETSSDVPFATESVIPGQQHIAAKFILQCLLIIPLKLCASLANQMFLDPLGQVVGSSISKQLLAQLCVTLSERNRLEKLGCLLGIQDWITMTQHKFKLSESDVQHLPSELEDVIETVDDVQVEEDNDDEYEDDFDDILSGDFDTDITIGTDRDEIEHSDQNSDVSADSDSPVIIEETVVDVLDEDDKPGPEESEAESAVSVCEAFINQIRKDEFGVGIQLSDDGERLMKVQQERLGRSLDRLSKDLYSKDTHFVLELIQNADDNSYDDSLLSNQKDDCPAVKFVIEHDGIYVLNNELGFREKDIKALCDVGRSTKGKHKFGYIGQKGIGFKSVFRVTDSPEVHSNGFHIKFDVNSGPMGYILPHWIPKEEQVVDNGWTTNIILRLKTDMLKQTRTLAARFNDIHPSLLLFLHRLRKITIENKVEHGLKTMHRRDVGNSIIEIQHTECNTCERWLVVKSTLDASKISLQAKSGADVESTEIALAFPIKASGQKIVHKVLPPKQPVFAFLPLRSYGFRFIIQGDFDVPSSREDVDRDSSWNQWLRNEIHTVFIDALDVFKSHPEYDTMNAVCTFLQFVPMEDEVLDFFKPVAADILRKLKGKPCIPTQPNSQGVISWKIPSQTVRVEDHRIRSVITPELLQTHLNLFYLHSEVASNLNPALTSCLGIETLSSEHLSKLGRALITDMGSHCKCDNDVIVIAKWLACMYCSLDEFHNEDEILTTIKSHPLLPLSDGELVSLKDKTVFYPIPDSGKSRQEKDPFYYLQQDVNSLHPLLLNTGDDEVNSQVHKLLVRLGIKKMSAGDVINHHIIPVLKSEVWKTKSKHTLISYLIYIKLQTDKQPSVCNMDDVRDVAVVWTNHEFKHPSQDCVHFPQNYGNSIDLKRDFPGYDWTILSSCYLPSQPARTDVISWRSFFIKLGVEDFLSVRKNEVQILKDNLASSCWSTVSGVWPKEEEYIVRDYQCVELEKLIHENLHPDGAIFIEQMRSLCVHLDRMWDKHYSKYCSTSVLDKNGKVLKETQTSFSIILRTSQWLPGFETETNICQDGSVGRKVGTVMKEPSSLYLRSKVVFDLMAEKVLYLDVKIDGGSFFEFLGLKMSVEIDTVKEKLLTWCSRSNNGTPADFCTSLVHIKKVYIYLSDNLTRQDLKHLLQKCPVLFVPNKKEDLERRGEVIPGKFLSREEVWLCDKTGLMEKHRQLLIDFHSDLSCKQIMQIYYMDRLDLVQLFTTEGRIDKHPSVEEYLELLCLLCSTSTPKKSDILQDVFKIFSTIGTILCSYREVLDSREAEIAVQPLKTKLLEKLQKEKVFPTKGQVWVSLADEPFIADNKEYEKMFEAKEGVHFLDMEYKKKGHGRLLPPIDESIQQTMIDFVTQMCPIKKLSDVVNKATVPTMIEPCDKLQIYFHKVVPAIQQVLMARFETVYLQHDQINTQQVLASAKFYQTKMIEVSYVLESKKISQPVVELREEICSIDPPTFYIQREHVDSTQEINKEIARYFSCGDRSCNNALRSFLSELAGIISGGTDETVEGLLQRYDVDVSVIPDENTWSVEPPFVPEPEILEPEPEEPVDEEIVEIVQESQHEGPFELRMWPPVANDNRRVIRADGSERPTSNIWPPPQGMDYMKSVKDLPSNIRVAAADKTADGTLSTKQTTESGMESYAAHVLSSAVQGQSTGIGSQPAVPGMLQSEPPVREAHSATSTVTKVTSSTETQIKNEEKESVVSNSADDSTASIRPSDHKEIHHTPGMAKQGERESNTEEKHSQINHPASVDQHRVSDHPRQHSEGPPLRMIHVNRNVNSSKHDWFASDDPTWSEMATEYSVDDLGSSGDLCKFVTFTLEVNAGEHEIGRWGEALVAQYLQHQKDTGKIHHFVWKNEESEKGSPYDFEVQYNDGNNRCEFIEVKSTCSNTKEVFPISIHQIRFAEEKKENFHIYRVFNAGNSDLVRLIRISDLSTRMSTKQVNLCMLI